jgi:hypothetical protein
VARSPVPDDILAILARLQKQIDEIGRKTNSNFTVTDPVSGTRLLYVGPDATGRQVFEIRRDNGTLVERVVSIVSGQQYWALYDRQNNILFSDDSVSGYGIASPWISFPMYEQFTMAQNIVYQYMSLPTTSVAAETTLWEGRIPLMLHGFVGVSGVWGAAIGTNTSTYRLKLNGTTVGTWNQSTLVVSNPGPFDAHTFINTQWIAVTLTCIATSGTGNVACQVYAATCRGS